MNTGQQTRNGAKCELDVNENSAQRESKAHWTLIKDAIEWDVRNWSHCLDFWASVAQVVRPGSARVLTIGERHGGIGLWFALRGYRVVCSDFRGPTAYARELHQKYGVAHLISYSNVNAFSIPYPENSFEIVACKSVIGGLKLTPRDASTRSFNNQSIAVAEIHRVTKPGGFFCGAENLTGTVVHRVLRNWIKKGRIGWRHLSVGEIADLFAHFETVEQRAHGFIGSRFTWAGFDRVTAAADSLICPFLPAHWQYISFIRAKKSLNANGAGERATFGFQN